MNGFRRALGVCLLQVVGLGLTHAGTYRLNAGDRMKALINGKSLPSCGAAAAAVLEKYAVMTVVHDPKAGTVQVNSEKWTLVELNGNKLAQLELKEPVSFLLTVHFLNAGSFARGRITIMGLDENRSPTCHDGYWLSGSYKR